MRIVIALVLAIPFLDLASAVAQPMPKNNPVLDPGPTTNQIPGMFDYPGGNPDEDNTPSNISPRLGWLRADYVFWYAKRQIVPPLIQVIPDSLATAATLPAGAANTLYPEDGQHVRYRPFGGVRLSGGFWFNPDEKLGIDGSFFMLEQNSNGAGYVSNGSPILARFYTNANSGVLTSLIFSNPDPATGYSGSLASVASMTSLWGADANFRWNGYRVFSDNTDWLLGFRYFDMREALNIGGAIRFQDGSRLLVNDYFKVSNQFYGAQTGFHARWGNFYGFSVDGIVKLAVGGVDQRVEVRGDNTLIAPNGAASRQEAGLYAQPSNIGVHRRGKFAWSPEATVNLNYNLTERAAIFVGYNFYYLSSVMRVGNAIDERVSDANIRYIANPTQGPVLGPTFNYRSESFWMQGVNLGLRLEY